MNEDAKKRQRKKIDPCWWEGKLAELENAISLRFFQSRATVAGEDQKSYEEGAKYALLSDWDYN
jgi:hypothetical protein